jgi:hypothetical protein
MNDNHKHKELEETILQSLATVPGILAVRQLLEQDREPLLEIEKKAEEQSLMSLGKVVNVGVRTILRQETIFVALNSMDFDWGTHPTLLMKKGEEIVGEEIRDQERIKQLSDQENVWFMHKNFIVYKDKISFPQDIMQKICYFEIPYLPIKWKELEECQKHCQEIIVAAPATPSDVYLKEQYFQKRDEQGLGTCLIAIYSKT